MSHTHTLTINIIPPIHQSAIKLWKNLRNLKTNLNGLFSFSHFDFKIFILGIFIPFFSTMKIHQSLCFRHRQYWNIEMNRFEPTNKSQILSSPNSWKQQQSNWSIIRIDSKLLFYLYNRAILYIFMMNSIRLTTDWFICV